MKQVEPKSELAEESTPPKGNGMTEKEAQLTEENEKLRSLVATLQQQVGHNGKMLDSIKGITGMTYFVVNPNGKLEK